MKHPLQSVWRTVETEIGEATWASIIERAGVPAGPIAWDHAADLVRAAVAVSVLVPLREHLSGGAV